jgi:predicted PhzF superfamily epimerase YddE/YHI9
VATASIILEVRQEVPGSVVRFHSKSGILTVEREGDLYALDFPARRPSPCAIEGIGDALGAEPEATLCAADCMAVFGSQEEVLALRPDFAKVAALKCWALIATAPGKDCDFVSRFFAPAQGIDEDPVTGRAHTSLTPYWAERLGKKKIFGRQVSERGGELWCEDRGDRVKIAGRAIQYLEGVINVPQPK